MKNVLMNYIRTDCYNNESKGETRFQTIEKANEFIARNSNENYKYKIISVKVLSDEDLDKIIMDENNKGNKKAIGIEKIGNIQIVKYKENEELFFMPYIDYEESNYIFHTLDEALLFAISYKKIGSGSQAMDALYFINKMLG